MTTANQGATIARVRIPTCKGDDAAMTFRDFTRIYGDQLVSLGYSLETKDKYAAAYLQFLAYAKGRGLADDIRSFNEDAVWGFAQDLQARRAHPNTIRRILSSLSSLARFGMMARNETTGKRWMISDPTRSFRWPQAQHQETQYLYPEELAKLTDGEIDIYKAIARDLLIKTGIRAGEASRLDVQHFREVDGCYYIALKVKRRGDQRKSVTGDIPVSKSLGVLLRDWLLARGHVGPEHDERPLLINSAGQRWNRKALSNMIARLGEASGITRLRVSAHKLRHTREVMDRRAGIDPAVRARMRLRSSVRSLDRYDHVLPDELVEAVEQSDEGTRAYLGDRFLPIAESEGEARNQQPSKSARTQENE